jgi:hypothetical protein
MGDSTSNGPIRQMKRTFSQSSQSAEELMKANVVQTAFSRGIWGALYGGVTGGAAMFLANKYNWLGIRKGLSISGKTGLIVTAAVAPFWLRGELTIIEGQQHPERFGGKPDGSAVATAPRGPKSLALWQKGLNFVYDNPVYTWAGIVVPAYAAIFA